MKYDFDIRQAKRKVGAGDTAQWPANGLVKCEECDYSRQNSSAGVVLCRVFENGHQAEVTHVCTAYRPAGWTLDHNRAAA